MKECKNKNRKRNRPMKECKNNYLRNKRKKKKN